MKSPLPINRPPAFPLYSTSEIRVIEKRFAATHPRASLMQRAGAATAKFALSVLKAKKSSEVLILAGPGNNGGDAWVTAALLKKAGMRVTVLTVGEQKFTDAAAKAAHALYISGKGTRQGTVIKQFPTTNSFDLIIDGLFGIGLARAPAGPFATVIQRTNALRQACDVITIAIDIPSGLSADTGIALGDTIIADHTITFLALKPGLFTGHAKDFCGEIQLETLSVVTEPSQGALLNADAVRPLIPSRRQHSHKGTYGNVGIIGGAEGMVGAAILSARAALFMGPGKVFVGVAAKEVPAFDPLNPELMIHRADELVSDKSLTALGVGMGLGTEKAAPRLLVAALARNLPTVLDADALNLLSAAPTMGALVAKREINSSTGAASQTKLAGNARQSLSLVMTPHPGEASRLLGITVAQVEFDRVTAALAIARRFDAVVVLKGSGTVIAAPDGRYFINTSGNPGMASGGMGDALSGMIGAFLAQGMDAVDASCLAVYLHGAAADECITHGMAPHGLTASEVIFEARSLLNGNLAEHEH